MIVRRTLIPFLNSEIFVVLGQGPAQSSSGTPVSRRDSWLRIVFDDRDVFLVYRLPDLRAAGYRRLKAELGR
jgi:hypothetical protein